MNPAKCLAVTLALGMVLLTLAYWFWVEYRYMP